MCEHSIKKSCVEASAAVPSAALTGGDALQSLRSSEENTNEVITNSSKPSPTLYVIAVHVNDETFEGSGDTKKKAKAAACAEALLKLYHLHCDVAPGIYKHFF